MTETQELSVKVNELTISGDRFTRLKKWSPYLVVLPIMVALVLSLAQHKQTQHQDQANKLIAARISLLTDINNSYRDVVMTNETRRIRVTWNALNNILLQIKSPVAHRKFLEDALPIIKDRADADRVAICKKIEPLLRIEVGEEVFKELIPASTCDNPDLAHIGADDRLEAAKRIMSQIGVRYLQEEKLVLKLGQSVSNLVIFSGLLGVVIAVFGVATSRAK